MCIASVFEFLSLVSIALFVFVPAAAINRRRDNAIQNLTPEEIWQRTTQEVDELVAWYHAQVSRDAAVSFGAAYARFSTKYQESIVDQLRKIFERAIQLRIFIPCEHVFFDLATSGRKKRRVGLLALEKVLRAKKARTLLLFSTSRLFRKQYRTLEFVDQVHKSWGIRCIFVASGIDTNDRKQWEMLLHAQSMVDQFVVTMNVDSIRAAHEGLLEKRYVFGTISFGYYGEVIAGEFSPKGKPRRRLMIDPLTAAVVALIFRLFVHERRKLNEIVRILNGDPTIPRPPQCRTGRWSREAVVGILKNTRYRALWRYGVTEAIYVPDADYVRQIPRLEPLKEAHIEELRIINDAEWFAAASLLVKNNRGGRKPKDGNHKSRPKVLNGLLHCEVHRRPLVVSGAHGRHMVCPVCQCLPAAKRPLLSWLNREVALRLTCKELAGRILDDEDLVQQVIEACRLEAASGQRQPARKRQQLQVELDRLKSRIDFAFRNVGETEEDQAETTRLLRELRTERATVEAELQRLSAARNVKIRVPKTAEVRRALTKLAKLLTDAGQSGDPSDTATLRCLFEELIDGHIVISQQGERRRQHGWLRGTFRVRLLDLIVERVANVPVRCNGDAIEVTIDYKRPLSTDAKADKAWQMHHDKKRPAEIAKELGCSKPYITKLLKHAAKKNGVKWVDGRSVRLNFPPQNRKPALYQQIAEKAVSMFDDGELFIGEIAELCGLNRATIKKAIAWSYKQRGLAVPNGRTRAGRVKRNATRASVTA